MGDRLPHADVLERFHVDVEPHVRHLAGALEEDRELRVLAERGDTLDAFGEHGGHEVVLTGLQTVERRRLVVDEPPVDDLEERLLAPVVLEAGEREARVRLVVAEHVRAGPDHLAVGVVLFEEVLRHDVAGRLAELPEEGMRSVA